MIGVERKIKGKFILICLLLVVLCGCSKETAKEEQEIQIGIVVYDEYDTFISQLMNHFMEEVSNENMNGKHISVRRYNAAGSQITENEQVEEMIEKGCNVLCVNLVDRTDPSMIIEAARNADIPVIFFNRELVEKDLLSWDKLYYVGADAFESGTMQGEIAADIWFQNPAMDKNKDQCLQYAVLEGEAGHQDAIVRSEYSVNALVDAGIRLEKCESSIANWNRAQAQTKAGQLFNKYGNSLELILCNNDDMALGAIDELKARKVSKEKWPVIVGIDGTDVGLDAVLSDEMMGTVYNNKEGQAKALVHLAISIITGDDFSDIPMENGKYVRFPYEKITKDNISDYIK